MATWIKDDKGNKCSVEYFGSEERAQAALDSLVGCINCTNCSDCSDCSGCSDCSDCSRCSDCSGCSRCSDCSGCSRCSDCSGCSGCSGCSDCSDCSRCSDCSDCSGCSRCYGCSDCSGCSRCSDCSGKNGDLAFPKVDNLLGEIKAAVSREDFNMSRWEHDCGTPACLAGHIVHAAGKEGHELKNETSFPFAAMQISRASGLSIPPTWFYGDNATAIDRVNSLKSPL